MLEVATSRRARLHAGCMMGGIVRVQACTNWALLLLCVCMRVCECVFVRVCMCACMPEHTGLSRASTPSRWRTCTTGRRGATIKDGVIRGNQSTSPEGLYVLLCAVHIACRQSDGRLTLFVGMREGAIDCRDDDTYLRNSHTTRGTTQAAALYSNAFFRHLRLLTEARRSFPGGWTVIIYHRPSTT